MPRTSAAGTVAAGRAASSAVARRTHPPTALTANAKITITVPRSISRWVVVRIYLSCGEPSRGTSAPRIKHPSSFDGGPALLFQQVHRPDLHAPVHRFHHVVDGQERHTHRRQDFHFHA